MIEEPFDLEDTLQQLVANHPELLSGEQIMPSAPRRWVLIQREQGIADTEGGAYRWAVDHLLIDQDAVPTLVEVKRSSNSQVRREVVGQMLDYAAHARQTWDVDDIRRAFERNAAAAGQDPINVLMELLQSEDEPDVEGFWQKVATNLRAARLRLLFVADGIPDELARVVEFLNEQMPSIEVLAVEIKQFRGETGQTLVPRVIGRTAAALAQASRSSPVTSPITREEFLQQMPSTAVEAAARRLLEVADGHPNAVLRWMTGGATISGICPVWPNPVTVARLYPPERTTWPPLRDFTFSAGNGFDGFLERLPSDLRSLLDSWNDEFSEDDFASWVSAVGVQGWVVTHEDAAANIDLLATRLHKVLTDIGRLQPEGASG